jgi:two-component system, NarL family, nitrate/nitrite response regulator NarL
MNRTLSRPSGSSLSVLLAHPGRLVREGIAGILYEAGFVVVEQTDAIDQLHQMVKQQKPDILLIDWELLKGQVDVLRGLATEFPASRIVVFSSSQPPPILRTLLEAGASGCLSLNLSSEELMESLNIIARGDIIVSRGIAEQLVQGMTESDDQGELFNSLSERQREIISLIVDGLTNREIASTLIITENTVKVHLRNILDKLDLRNRQQLAAVAVQKGLVALNDSEEEPACTPVLP